MDKIFFTKEHIYKRDLKEEDLTPEEWDLHHRFEIDSFYTLSVQELKALDLYFNRPADELIYLRHNEHAALHNKYRK